MEVASAHAGAMLKVADTDEVKTVEGKLEPLHNKAVAAAVKSVCKVHFDSS